MTAPLTPLSDGRNVLFELVPPEELTGGMTEVQAYLFLADLDGTPLTAAAEVQTGAMIALVPTTEDAARLALEGFEAADQLHVTLVYLGDAADFSAEQREEIINIVRRYADDELTARAFAVNIFNPRGDEPCIVLGIGNDENGKLEQLRSNIMSAINGNFTIAENHSPWVPHLTLAYTDHPVELYEQAAARTGPVTFDRVRVAFGGENTDIPLGTLTASFNESQPRADDGRWINRGASTLSDQDEFKKIQRKAVTGKKALKSAKTLRNLAGNDDVKLQSGYYYMGGGYETLNAQLRNDDELSPLNAVAITNIDAMHAASRLTRDVTVTRGIRDPKKIFTFAWDDDGDNTGLEWRDDAVISTTTDSEVAEWHASREDSPAVIMNMLVPEGIGAIHLEHATADSRQLLLERRLWYRVVKDYGKDAGGIRRMDVVVLPRGKPLVASAAAELNAGEITETDWLTGKLDLVGLITDDGSPVTVVRNPQPNATVDANEEVA